MNYLPNVTMTLLLCFLVSYGVDFYTDHMCTASKVASLHSTRDLHDEKSIPINATLENAEPMNYKPLYQTIRK